MDIALAWQGNHIAFGGVAFGLEDRSWCEAYLKLRSLCGLNAIRDKCNMRVPIVGGAFADARLGATDLNVWLRHYLSARVGLRAELVRKYSSRSAKAIRRSVASRGPDARGCLCIVGQSGPFNNRV